MAQSKSGSFTGGGSITVDINIGFEPDVIIIDSGLKTDEANIRGVLSLCIAKNLMSVNFYHATTADTARRVAAYQFQTGEDAWGTLDQPGETGATYANGVLQVTNYSNNANYYFNNGTEYSWTAYKA